MKFTSGNVIGLLSASGLTVAAQYRYKPFGSLERNDQTVQNALRFQGRPFDAETNLYYFRARYYDPQLARFISEDPAGKAGGINAYTYAANDPINNGDPTGMMAASSHGVCSITLDTCGGGDELEAWIRGSTGRSGGGGSQYCYVGGSMALYDACMRQAGRFLGTAGPEPLTWFVMLPPVRGCPSTAEGQAVVPPTGVYPSLDVTFTLKRSGEIKSKSPEGGFITEWFETAYYTGTAHSSAYPVGKSLAGPVYCKLGIGMFAETP